MKNLFNSIKLTKPKRNHFDLTHDVKLSLDMGNLVPIMCMETVPGDSVSIATESLIRFAPLVSPAMHRYDATFHYYFVPNRIIWDGWESWITSQDTDRGFPNIIVGDGTTDDGTLSDYLGVPKVSTGTLGAISALPFAAYQAIYNEYYRDQNLIPEVDYKLIDGDNSANADLLVLRKRAWEHDYFTASLPFAQKGDSVDIPVGSIDHDVKVFRNHNSPYTTTLTGSPDNQVIAGRPSTNDDIGADNLYANTENLTVGSAKINDLRRAFRLQEWLERNARVGTRYVESILGHFGVKSSDARLQRAEYITGSKSPVVISEILNTAGTFDSGGDPTSPPQGSMAGHGVSVTQGHQGSYFCEEHGYIIGIMSVMPKTAYQQGLPRHFIKGTDQFFFYWPEFANIGEQEVYNLEIFANEAGGFGTFGYVPRYAEYKYLPSRVSGEFRGNLDFWHSGRIFDSRPSLNQEFIECVPDKRIFAVTGDSTHTLYAHVLNKVSALRPMPKFGNPSF